MQAAAETNKRSMTAEIVAALEKEYPPSIALEEIARTIRLLEQMREDGPSPALRKEAVRGLRTAISHLEAMRAGMSDDDPA